MRWVGELAEYHFDIKYQPGRVSADVDTLSRMSMDIDEYEASCSEHISKEAFIASVSAVLSNVTYDYITTIADIVSIATDMNNARLKKVNLVEEQNKDPNISRIVALGPHLNSGEGKVLLYVNFCMNLTGCLFVKMEFSVERLGIISR